MKRVVRKYEWKGSNPLLFRDFGAFDAVMYLNSNAEGSSNLLAINKLDEVVVRNEGESFEKLKAFMRQHEDWCFGYFSYDLKNELEALSSENHDGLQFPAMHFFRPEFVVQFLPGEMTISYDAKQTSAEQVDALFEELTAIEMIENNQQPITFRPRISKEQYLHAIQKLQQHIQRGDVYEINFCHEFYAEHVAINPWSTYRQLNTKTKAPFSFYYQHQHHYAMGGSPERFMRKTGNNIISQPIKGTIKRGQTPEEDEMLKQQLFNDPKERGENVMIVDLVRNDLSKIAAKGSVKVEELFGIYTFETVHQMISTVVAEQGEDVHPVDVIQHAFPMGSMTGAPKVRAMQLIEEYESTQRGLYSGAVGYFKPDGDFDFNVVIRSLLYNANRQYLSYMVGGAITAKADPLQEYQESLLKGEAMFNVFQQPVDA